MDIDLKRARKNRSISTLSFKNGFSPSSASFAFALTAEDDLGEIFPRNHKLWTLFIPRLTTQKPVASSLRVSERAGSFLLELQRPEKAKKR